MPLSPAFADSTFRKWDGVIASPRSSFTKRTQTAVGSPALWTAEYTLPLMTRAEAQPWAAFIWQLQGRAGRFYGYNPDYRTPLGAASGTPQVNGAGQANTKSLITDGWSNSTLVLMAGDFIAYDTTLGRELRAVTANVTSDGSGNATLALDEPIRVAPADNATIITSDASCVMQVIQNEEGLSGDRVGIQELTFRGIEAFGA